MNKTTISKEDYRLLLTFSIMQMSLIRHNPNLTAQEKEETMRLLLNISISTIIDSRTNTATLQTTDINIARNFGQKLGDRVLLALMNMDKTIEKCRKNIQDYTPFTTALLVMETRDNSIEKIVNDTYHQLIEIDSEHIPFYSNIKAMA